MSKPVVILANGRFPKSGLPLGYLDNSERIVCCDGSVLKLLDYGLEPWAIVGDLDSVTERIKEKFNDRLFHSDDQDTNDLTKAVRFCIKKGITNIVILGATGLREDHTLGNISLLADYADSISVKMITDYGVFIPVKAGAVISSWPGQQVSIFTMDKEMLISSTGLKYPLEKTEFQNWWMGTLNECKGDSFSLSFDHGRVLAFLEIPT